MTGDKDVALPKMLEELGLKKLHERRSITKWKILHSFYHSYKFVTPSLLPSKIQNANLRFKPIAILNYVM